MLNIPIVVYYNILEMYNIRALGGFAIGEEGNVVEGDTLRPLESERTSSANLHCAQSSSF